MYRRLRLTAGNPAGLRLGRERNVRSSLSGLGDLVTALPGWD
jgi:hypothetical protein